MIEMFHSLIIGIVQGLAEFLPISSSAHLVLVPYLLGWQYRGLDFDIALHLGTAVAILAFFWRDWLVIIQNGLGSKIVGAYPKSLLWQILVASIPAAILGFLLESRVEKYFHSPLLLALNLAVFGVILWLVDRNAKQTKQVAKTGFKESFLIGLAQCLALVPGVSRAGITMITARGIGYSREEGARLSFLIGTPAMFGAFLLTLKDLSGEMITAPFVVGVVVSTISGYLAIKYLLDFFKKGDFRIFVWYRLVLAAIVFAVFFLRK